MSSTLTINVWYSYKLVSGWAELDQHKTIIILHAKQKRLF